MSFVSQGPILALQILVNITSLFSDFMIYVLKGKASIAYFKMYPVNK